MTTKGAAIATRRAALRHATHARTPTELLGSSPAGPRQEGSPGGSPRGLTKNPFTKTLPQLLRMVRVMIQGITRACIGAVWGAVCAKVCLQGCFVNHVGVFGYALEVGVGFQS